MVSVLVFSTNTKEYGLPRNSGELSLTSSTGISLRNDTVFGSAPPTDSSTTKQSNRNSLLITGRFLAN